MFWAFILNEGTVSRSTLADRLSKYTILKQLCDQKELHIWSITFLYVVGLVLFGEAVIKKTHTHLTILFC